MQVSHTSREVASIDDLGGSERDGVVALLGLGHGNDGDRVAAGELDEEAADGAQGSVDEQRGSGREVQPVHELAGGQSGQWDGRGLFETQAVRHPGHQVGRQVDVLGVGPVLIGGLEGHGRDPNGRRGHPDLDLTRSRRRDRELRLAELVRSAKGVDDLGTMMARARRDTAPLEHVATTLGAMVAAALDETRQAQRA